MSRFRKTLHRYEIPGEARYITFSCYHRLQLLNNSAIRDALAAQIELVHTQRAFRLLSWVIMPEHVHLFLIPTLPDWPLPRILRSIKGPFAQNIMERWRDLNAPILKRLMDTAGSTRFWQRGGGYDRNIVLD